MNGKKVRAMTIIMHFIRIKYHAGGIDCILKCDVAFSAANPAALTTQNPITL